MTQNKRWHLNSVDVQDVLINNTHHTYMYVKHDYMKIDLESILAVHILFFNKTRVKMVSQVIILLFTNIFCLHGQKYGRRLKQI